MYHDLAEPETEYGAETSGTQLVDTWYALPPTKHV
jgi:hypothetical protein